MTKRVLVLGYSQTGQLTDLVDSIVAPLQAAPDVELVYQALEPETPFPFPWPFLTFFNNFPETVYEEPIALKPLSIDVDDHFDLIILAYQVWFLSPSRPVSSFLQLPGIERLLNGKPVVTVIGCRNMWLMAQEKMKDKLRTLGARLVDNIVLTDSAHSAFTFIATPLWMLTGNQGPWLGGLIPKAGIAPEEIAKARRFGEAIAQQLPHLSPGGHTMLQGLGAVQINERLIASEKIAHRSFQIWGKLLRKIGDQTSFLRRCVLIFYIIFLVTMILTVVPISAILKRLFAPLLKQRTAQQKAYFAGPSGEATSKLD